MQGNEAQNLVEAVCQSKPGRAARDLGDGCNSRKIVGTIAFVKGFNGRLRDELLFAVLFSSLGKMAA